MTRFFAWFNRVFGRTTEKYASASAVLIHKSGFAMIGLVLVALLAVFIGGRLPTGFLPQEATKAIFFTHPFSCQTLHRYKEPTPQPNA